MKTVMYLCLCAAATYGLYRLDGETARIVLCIVGAFTIAYWLTRLVRWLDGEVS